MVSSYLDSTAVESRLQQAIGIWNDKIFNEHGLNLVTRRIVARVSDETAELRESDCGDSIEITVVSPESEHLQVRVVPLGHSSWAPYNT